MKLFIDGALLSLIEVELMISCLETYASKRALPSDPFQIDKRGLSISMTGLARALREYSRTGHVNDPGVELSGGRMAIPIFTEKDHKVFQGYFVQQILFAAVVTPTLIGLGTDSIHYSFEPEFDVHHGIACMLSTMHDGLYSDAKAFRAIHTATSKQVN